eukprot:2504813-Rhodomonas_salina.1
MKSALVDAEMNDAAKQVRPRPLTQHLSCLSHLSSRYLASTSSSLSSFPPAVVRSAALRRVSCPASFSTLPRSPAPGASLERRARCVQTDLEPALLPAPAGSHPHGLTCAATCAGGGGGRGRAREVPGAAAQES